ncbi:hypothetical protein BDW02DRAFT_94887 [Decorospora gaudefroyi]|uniref:Cell wall protein PhiA n=1 Tax=Decorospora gaudefroyi TaxID=184978 RepID=A0A6A5K7U3_9PLEO|nr:hypothetical protein BDW02DRAFT_94887 [Decorospora gaudefroyi]
MKFSTAAAFCSALALTSAAPCGQTQADPEIKDGDVFRLITIRSGSPIQYGTVSARNRGLIVNSESPQNATCTRDGVNEAYFKLDDGSLYLNTQETELKFFVDRSGMGQGVMQYTSGPPVRNGETTGFAISESGHLEFKGTGFQACPDALGGGYTVWLSGIDEPAGIEGCLGFVAKAIKADIPIACEYTQ